jgi:hypothetical protein
MAATSAHSEEGKKLLAEMKDKGITDLDTLVRKITAQQTTRIIGGLLICNSEHFCIVVRPLPDPR